MCPSPQYGLWRYALQLLKALSVEVVIQYNDKLHNAAVNWMSRQPALNKKRHSVASIKADLFVSRDVADGWRHIPEKIRSNFTKILKISGQSWSSSIKARFAVHQHRIGITWSSAKVIFMSYIASHTRMPWLLGLPQLKTCIFIAGEGLA